MHSLWSHLSTNFALYVDDGTIYRLNTVEGVAVVNQLRATVIARDAEVKTLRTQVDIERALNAQPRRPDGGTTEEKP